MYKRDEISLLEREIVADSIDEFKMILDMLDYNIDVYDKKFAKNFDGFNPQSKQYQKCNPLHIVMNILKNLITPRPPKNILFFIDNNSIKYNQEINISIGDKDFTFLIKHPQEVLHTQFDKIFIATMTGCESCLKQLSSYGVDMAKVDSNYVMVKIQARINFLKSFAKECKDKGIVGNVAEVGVFQGEFAKKINTYLPHKTLFLFDTFEGFDKRDLEVETKETQKMGTYLSDTSIELVLSKMPYPNNVVIKKGYFLETASGLENETFCFVNLDADLYEPIKAGLEFFTLK